MTQFFTHLLDGTGFMRRWSCGDWSTAHGTMHIVCDIATSLAYFAVPCVVAYFVIGRRDIRFPRIFWVFLGLVFFSCGTVHLIEAIIFWWPVYRLSGLAKLITAVVSVTGVVVLVRVMPRALSLKTPEALDREVSERKLAEENLANERYLLHTLLDHLPDPIYFKDPNGRFTRISRSLADRLGLRAPSEAIGKTDADYFPAESAAKAREDEKLVVKEGTPIDGKEECLTWPNGEQSWMLTTRIRLENTRSEIVGTCSISHDITTRKAAEEALRESEERFELAVRGSSDGIWDWTVPTNVVYYSPRFKELLGYKDHEMTNVFSSWESKLHPDDRDVTLAEVRQHLERRKPYDVEYRLLTKAGKYRWYRARGQAVWDENGNALRMAGSITDITERKAAEYVLAERARLSALTGDVGLALTQQEGLDSILQQCAQALVNRLHAAFARIWLLNANDNVLELRASAGIYTHLDGGHSRVPVGKLKIGLIASERKPHLTNSVIGDPRVSDQDWAHREGMVAFAGYPLMLGDQLVGVMAMFARQKLSEETLKCMSVVANAVALGIQRKQTEVALQEAVEAAEAASRAKSDFLANMSHEIRTPMHAVIGLTELLLETDLDSTQTDYAKTVLDSAESLLSIINEILDFSKIESGKLELERVKFDIREELGDTMKVLGRRAHQKDLELTCHVEQDVPAVLFGDPVRLRQVFVNLISNAVKFTESGEIVVRAACRSCSQEEVQLHFSVRDTGIGIPTEKLTDIFSAFEQADSSTTRRFGGTGLGLAISSSLVERMNGHIWAESELGKGSTFHFTACFGVAEKSSNWEPDAAGLQGLVALVVDDNETNLFVLKEMLANWGLQVETAASGSEALDIMQNILGQGGRAPLVLTDVNMPEMDGFMLAERIRQLDEMARSAIIMLTSGGRAGDLERAKQLGIAMQLMKPVKQSELLDAVLDAVGTQEYSTPLHEAGDERTTVRSLRILLAEDGIANQKLATGLLIKWGHSVTVANNGRKALEMYKEGEFDLILMDLQMPEMDGIEATRRIRAYEKKRGIRVPIVAMTARAMERDRELCLEAGMDAYVSKPVRQGALYEAIAPYFAEDEPAGLEHKEDPQQELDWQKILNNVAGDEELLSEVIDAVLEEVPKLFVELDHAIERGDAATMRRLAHTIKGSLRTFEISSFNEVAFQLERLGSDGKINGAAELTVLLKEEFEKAKQLIKKRQ